MKTVPIILLSVSVCIIAILMVSSAYAQYGGGPMCCRPSASLSQIVSSGDDVYAIWYNATNLQTNQYDAFLKTSTDGGTSFGNAINITNSLGIKPYDFTVKLGAVAFGDSLYLSWSNWKNGANTSNVFIAKSTDKGNTFAKPLVLKDGPGTGGIWQLTASGNHIYALMGNSTDFAYSDLLFRTSNDGGTTFGKTISLSQNHKFMVGDTQMISSGNNVYITEDGSYWGSSNGAVLFMASHDNGSTFDHVTISNDTMVFAPQFAVSGNNVYIVWAEMKDQVTSIFLKKSTNGGIDFSDKIKLNTQNGDVRWPKLVLVNGTDGLSVEWTQTLQSGESKLFIVKSMDGGNTFGIPFDLGGFTTGNFDFSQIGVLENGTIYAIWTGEYDPSYSHSGVFFRTSTDGGKTFGNIFDLNSQNKSGISNPIVVSSQNHIYVAGDSGTFRASNDLGSTFTYVANLDTVKPSNASIAEPLFLVPEFKQDIPTLEPTNSQFSNSQNASFVLGQPNFVSNSQSPTASTFFTPHFIMFDSQGDLWVSDGGNDRVLEFKPPFTLGETASIVLGQSDFTSWQVLDGTTPKSLWHPQGLTFDSQGNLWVADGGSNRVLEFAPPFKTRQDPLLVLGHHDFTSGDPVQPSTGNSIYYPGGVTFDSSGNLWVADTSNRLLEFAPPFSSGQNASLILGNFTSDQGISAGMVSQPLGIAFDKNGNLWVADSGNYRVLRFDAPFSSGQAASLVLGHTDFTTGGEGVSSGASTLRDPYGITFDIGGNLWVADSGNNRVLEFTTPFSSGQNASLILGQTSFNAGAVNTGGYTASSLDQPHGIAFDKNGNLWVADSENNRILAFASNQSNGTWNTSYPNSGIVLNDSSTNSSIPNAYDEAATKMEDCSKKLSIASDNQTALNLVLNSSEFQSKIQGFDYKPDGITNNFHNCTLGAVQVVYSLYDKNGTYVKSLYVSVDSSLTKILGIQEETNNVSFGGSIHPALHLPPQQSNSSKTDMDIAYKSESSGGDTMILVGITASIAVGIVVVFLVRSRRLHNSHKTV